MTLIKVWYNAAQHVYVWFLKHYFYETNYIQNP